MKQANVSELKAHLSAYLTDARKGETIVVCERSTPIAKIVPVDVQSDGLIVDEPQRHGKPGEIKGVPTRKPIDSARLLRLDRDRR